MGSYFFGEIVEPTTRALVDENIENYPAYEEIRPEWEGNAAVPNKIHTIIFIESDNLKKIFGSSIIHNNPVCGLKNGGINIYDVEDNIFIITFFEQKQLNTCQIVEALANWILVAEKIYTITTDSVCKYQNSSFDNKPASIIRTLSNVTMDTSDYVHLEPPNLVTGLGSGVLTYCIHMRMMKCSLFIAYMDISPLDSLNSGPLLTLLSDLNIKIVTILLTSLAESEFE